MDSLAAKRLARLREFRTQAKLLAPGARAVGDKNWDKFNDAIEKIVKIRVAMIKRSFQNKNGKDLEKTVVDLSREGIRLGEGVEVDLKTGKTQKIISEVPNSLQQASFWIDVYQSIWGMELAKARGFPKLPFEPRPREQFLRDQKTIFNRLQDIRRKTRRGK